MLAVGWVSRFEEVGDRQAGLAVDQVEGYLGSGCEVQRHQPFGEHGVCQAVKAGADERGGGAQRRTQGHALHGPAVEHDVAGSVQPAQPDSEGCRNLLEFAAWVGEQSGSVTRVMDQLRQASASRARIEQRGVEEGSDLPTEVAFAEPDVGSDDPAEFVALPVARCR